MPNLRSLDIDIIPKLFEALKLSAALFRDFFITEGPAESERLIDFLAAFSNLEELDIVFDWRGTQGYQQAQMIEMPNLKHLSIGSPYSKRHEIRPFMVALRTPILRKLEISMIAPVSEDERLRALDDIFSYEDYSSVESLTLKMKGGKSTRIHVPLKKLRGLRSLSLDLPKFVPYIPNVLVDGNDEFVPALHTLEL